MEKENLLDQFTVLGLAADFLLPLWWALIATIPSCLCQLVDCLSQRLVLKNAASSD